MILGFGLGIVFFTLANTELTTVQIIPGVNTSLPLAALLLLSAGIGACCAWIFAGWTGMLDRTQALELKENQDRITKLENDLSRYQLNRMKALPFMKIQKDQSEKISEAV